MTAAQNRVYKCVRMFINRHGHSPSYSEIASDLRLRSLASVHKHVHRLIEDGYLVQGASSARSLMLAPDKELPGFLCCDRAHRKIFFRESPCPVCELVLTRAREVTQVSVASSSPSLPRR